MEALFWTIATWTGVIWWSALAVFLVTFALIWIYNRYGAAAIAWILLILFMGIAGNFE